MQEGRGPLFLGKRKCLKFIVSNFGETNLVLFVRDRRNIKSVLNAYFCDSAIEPNKKHRHVHLPALSVYDY